MKKLKAYKARLTVDLIRELKRAQREIKKKILEAANDPDLAKSAKKREQLFREIEGHYKQLSEGIDAQLKELTGKVGEAEHKAALDTLPDARILRYDPERTARYFSIIHPSNERNIAALFTENMSENTVRSLRTAFVETFREATAQGRTANELQKALRDRWDGLAGDADLFRFIDRGGRRWENAAYLQMLVRTNAQRVATESRIDTYTANGYSLARIPPTVDSDCPICAAWAGRIIQIAGKSKDYPTYEEAQAAGMFHPNCVHYPEPIDELIDAKEIELQKQLDKPDADDMSDPDFMQRQTDQLDESRYTATGMSQEDARRAVTADRLETAIRIGTFSDAATSAARALSAEQLDIIRASGIPSFELVRKGEQPGQTYHGKLLVPRNPTADDILNLLKVDRSQIAPVASEPPPVATVNKPLPFPANPDNLRVVRQLGGSTGAELVEDEHGQRFVRKYGGGAGGDAADHVRAEAAADAAYRAMGVDVPAGRLYERDGMPPVKLTRYIDGGKSLGEYLNTATPEERKRVIEAIRKDFDIDVILGNRDVIGASRDNILVDNDGVPWRIDNGASLSWRAQGARKHDWDKWPGELFTMQDAGINKGIFDGISASQTVIRSLERDAAALLEAVPQSERAILRERIKEMQELGVRAADFRATGYTGAYNDSIVRHSLNLAKEGFRESVPEKVSQYSFGFFRSDSREPTISNDAPGGMPNNWQSVIIDAAKSINYHTQQGDAPNAAKVNAAINLKGALEKLTKDKAENAQYWLEAVNAISAAKDGGKIPMIDKSVTIADPAKKEKKESYTSLTDHAHDYIRRMGGDPDYIVRWQEGQAQSSWSHGACLRKIVQESARPMPNDTYIPQNSHHARAYEEAKRTLGTGNKMDVAAKTFAAYDAIVQLALENTKCANVDPEKRTAMLIRTESDATATRHKIAENKGKLMDFPRGACESHSIFRVTCVYGNNGTLVDVPFSLIKGAFFFERTPQMGGACFASDSENEIATDARGRPTLSIGKVRDGQHIDLTLKKEFEKLVSQRGG